MSKCSGPPALSLPKDDSVYVGHMLDTALKAVSLLKGKTRQSYDSDETLRLALAHLIQVFGEAARRVSGVFQQAHPEIPWEEIVGMRHKIVHDYLELDEDIVWQVVTVDLAAMIEILDRVAPAEEGK